ncbi:hypothetical protein [Rubritalea profundi]|uniref:Polyketide cyclase n=1 Tax=Rubritalea profundi TaxID=1658618 RepID=A0A2S7U2N1_9BACT|nr:hypothetical protein [Rubritalea profundi]PQJ29236.1 hypothetical protein BSZ32_12540 [Rubritalea profundi]
MKVTTSQLIENKEEVIWPLLTHSEMTSQGCFCLGVPKPMACELPNSIGGVGAERRCISDRGTVLQRILEWEPPSKLRFTMESTDHCWGPCIDSIEEEFSLRKTTAGTTVTRTTRFVAKGWLRPIKEIMFWVGLKRPHLFVFKNWKQQCEVDK